MNQPLAIVGASARAAAASAVRAGFQPVAADLFADADLRAIATATRISPYPEGLVDWLRAVEPPAWMYTGALENHPDLIDQMAWVAPLWGNSGDVLSRVRSPWELAAALRDAGLLFPETRSSPDGLPRDGSWLAKTYRGASGSGVRAWGEKPTTLWRPARSEGIDDLIPACFQKRIPGTPCAAVFVADGRVAEALGITRQLIGESWLGAGKFQYCGSIAPHSFGPQSLHLEVLDTIDRIGNVLADRFELIGLFGVDLVMDGNRVWTIEVNPRYTASVEIIERETDIGIMALHAAACNRASLESVPIRRSESLFHGKAILFAKRGLRVSPWFADWSLAEALKTPWPTLADVSPAGTMVEAGRPLLTVFAGGETVSEVEFRLREHVADIEKRLYGNAI